MKNKLKTHESTMRWKGFLTALIYFLTQTVLMMVVVLVVMGITPVKDGQTAEDVLASNFGIISIVPAAVGLLGIVLLNFKELKEKVIENLKSVKTYIWPFVVFFSYFVSVVIIGKLSMLYFDSIGGGEAITENEEAIQQGLTGDGRTLMVFYVLILAPILEELVFRYGIIEFLESFKFLRRLKFVPYLITAFLFAIIHETSIFSSFTIPNLISFILYFVPALILTFAYKFTNKNIMVVIFAHILMNSVPSLFN